MFDHIKASVLAELESFRIPEAKEAIKSYLEKPSLVRPPWPNGPCGKDQIQFWCVGQFPNFRFLFAQDQGTGILGGPATTGGLFHWVVSDDDFQDISGDDLWFSSLEDIFYTSGVWQGPLPEGYEVS